MFLARGGGYSTCSFPRLPSRARRFGAEGFESEAQGVGLSTCLTPNGSPVRLDPLERALNKARQSSFRGGGCSWAGCLLWLRLCVAEGVEEQRS